MFNKTHCNMTNRDSYIRAIIASFIMLFAFVTDSFFLAITSLTIFYTAYTKFCFVYFIFKINSRFSKNNYYLSLLPKHRTSPVFIFNNERNILFQNDPAKRVVKEIEKLSNDYVLINDFRLKFEKPIYNKQNGDRIFSIQIDHLLISPAGIFIIETKNWSKESIKNYNLRSPVEQIRRTSFAMFVVLNRISDKFGSIGVHHWGESQIPIKNLIVMINNKPKNIFKYVRILKLNELNNYISHFDKIYSKSDVNKITEILLDYNKSLLF